MSQLTLEVPGTLMQQLERLASEEKKRVDQVVLEQLNSLLEPPATSLSERYRQFCNESGLFVRVPEEEKGRYRPLGHERLKELAAKLGAAGPLSEVIIEERGQR